MTVTKEKQPTSTSTELTGGAGFTYEDTVVAYYLAALLREEHAAGQSGIVKGVAVQQAGHGHPMDDLIVEFDDAGIRRRLSLQVKRQLRIRAAASNTDFREIMAGAVATRATANFQCDLDCYGFVTEHVAVEPFRSLNRLIEWAKSDITGDDFAHRFTPKGTAAAAERTLRDDLLPLTEAQSADDEVKFYRQFAVIRLEGLAEGGVLRTEIVNRLQELIAVNDDGHDLLLFDRLYRIVRDGAGTARKWTRQTLLGQLRGIVRLKVAPNYRADIGLLQSFSAAGLADVAEEIEGFRVERPDQFQYCQAGSRPPHLPTRNRVLNKSDGRRGHARFVACSSQCDAPLARLRRSGGESLSRGRAAKLGHRRPAGNSSFGNRLERDAEAGKAPRG